MTDASNSTAQVLGKVTNLGFTNHDRPVKMPAVLDATVEIVFGGAPPDDAPVADTNAPRYLVGESGIIARNLKTFAFAKSRALYWSREAGATVAVCAQLDDGRIALEESVSAHVMSDGEYAGAVLLAERARLENVISSLDEITMDVRATREDAQEALDALKTASEIDGAPIKMLAGVMRGFAETFEASAWFVLIDEDDADMAGELTAS